MLILDLFILSKAKNLANVSCKVPVRDPSALHFVGITLIAVQFVFLDNIYIIAKK